MRLRTALLPWLLPAIVAQSTEADPPSAGFVATPWPEGDALFHQDPRWLGTDGAYSVDLGNDRVLWLFADSFVAKSAAHSRHESVFVRNSVAIESGLDPAHARMRFYWRGTQSDPQSFFPEAKHQWYWPGAAARAGNRLVIFLMRVNPTSDPGAFGFVETGWDAIVVENPEADPPQWTIRRSEYPQNPFGIIVGSGGVLTDHDYLYAYGSHEPAAHDMHMVRWPLKAAEAADFSSPEWWDPAQSAWIPQANLHACPEALIPNGATEITVHFEPKLNAFVEMQTEGFWNAALTMRTAKRVTGPWSAPSKGYRPPESFIRDVFVYAGKAHPELRVPGADIILSYATNALDLGRVVNDPTLYYPRLLKANWVHPQANQ